MLRSRPLPALSPSPAVSALRVFKADEDAGTPKVTPRGPLPASARRAGGPAPQRGELRGDLARPAREDRGLCRLSSHPLRDVGCRVDHPEVPSAVCQTCLRLRASGKPGGTAQGELNPVWGRSGTHPLLPRALERGLRG